MKFVHRLNVRALSAMVTGIMVASSMLASAAPVAAAGESANEIDEYSGLGLQGTILETTEGVFDPPATDVSYRWYRCTASVSAATNAAVPGTCTDTGFTGFHYTLSAADVDKPFIIAKVTKVSGGVETADFHYSDSYRMHRKPALDTTAPKTDHYPVITTDTTDEDGIDYAGSDSTLSIDVGDWVGYPLNVPPAANWEDSFDINWLRCKSASAKPTTSASCSRISAAEGGVDELTYSPNSNDVGFFIRVRIRAHNQHASVTIVSPSWSEGNPSKVGDVLNKASGAPFPTKDMSFAGRKANPGKWTAIPALDPDFGYTGLIALEETGKASNATPGYDYQWYACATFIEVQSYTSAAWEVNNTLSRGGDNCVELSGQTSRFLGEDYDDGYFVVAVTAQNIRGESNTVWSKSTKIGTVAPNR